jgi:phage terminase large subunit GpA-like protein
MMQQATLPRAIPAFVPPEIRTRLAGQRVRFDRLPTPIRRRMRTPEKIRVSEHARLYRVVTEEPHPGPWRHELAPHTVKIMDTYGLPHVREIWFCGVDQSGKTNSMLNCLHWAADVDPGNIFYLMPTEATGEKVTSEKLMPLVRASKRLKRYIGDRDNDITLSRIKLSHGVTIRPAWANSAASMATFAAKHCFGDEVDKYPERVGRETGPIAIIKKRNRLYRGRYKRFFASTPAQLIIYKGTMACRQVWEHYHRCPHCGSLFRPSGEGLNIPADLTAADITAETDITYNCTQCGAAITELERLEMLATPEWVCIKGAEVARPATVGFHHRAWDCKDVPLHEIAAAWMEAQHGGVVEKIAWANGYEAEDYQYEQQDRKEDFILRLRDEAQPRGVVPRDTCYLAVIADTQQIGFHYKVVAYGFGDDLPVAKIEHGYVETFAQLNDIALQVRRDAEGAEYRVQSGWIDSGGGTNPFKPKHSRTNEVYRFCKQYPFWRPIKGQRTLETGWSVKLMDYYPSREGKMEKIPGGLRRYNINVTLYKDELAGKLQREPDAPGAICLDAATTTDYARQLCAEYRDDSGFWQCPKGKDNHQWDCWVYALAAADIIGVRRFRREQPGRTAGPIVYSKGVQV